MYFLKHRLTVAFLFNLIKIKNYFINYKKQNLCTVMLPKRTITHAQPTNLIK